MSLIKRVCASALILSFANLLAAPIRRLSAQQGPVTIRARAAEVLVDAIVTDKRNRLVPDLKTEDFTIYENGVPQKVLSMRLARITPGPTVREAPRPAETAAPPVPVAAPQVEPPAQIPNLTIVLLDYSTTQFQNQKLVQDASVKYVEERLRPNDLMAVFVLSSSLRFLTDFTGDKAVLLAALRSKDVMGTATAAEKASLAEGIADARATLGPQTPATMTVTGAGAAAAGASMAAGGSARGAVMLAARIEDQFIALQSSLDKKLTRGILTAIRAIALGTAQIEGRKSLILFSQGFVVGEALEEELHAVVDVANRSRLAVYSIDTKGLESGWQASEGNRSLIPQNELSAVADKSQRDRMKAVGGETVFDRAIQAGSDQQESALRFVSNETGGFLIRNTNDLGIGLKRVDEETHGYYMLSYQPSIANYDGKYRQIRVEVRQPGLTVRARTGYYAIPTGFELLSPEEFQLFQAARSSGAAAPLFVRAGNFREGGNRYRVPVVLEIPARSVRFEQIGKISSAKLQVIGLLRDADRNLVARFGGRVQYNASEAEQKALQSGNISLLNTVESAPGAYTMEIVVKDLTSGVASYREQGLNLREQTPEFALSTVLLAKNVDKASPAAGQFLSVGGAKILPIAQCEFRNGDNLIYYFDIYQPKVEEDKRADVMVNIWLMRNGERLRVGLPSFRLTQAEPKPIPRITVARYLQLAGLEPGDYSLVVQVKDSLTERVELAQASFAVIR